MQTLGGPSTASIGSVWLRSVKAQAADARATSAVRARHRPMVRLALRREAAEAYAAAAHERRRWRARGDGARARRAATRRSDAHWTTSSSRARVDGRKLRPDQNRTALLRAGGL